MMPLFNPRYFPTTCCSCNNVKLCTHSQMWHIRRDEMSFNWTIKEHNAISINVIGGWWMIMWRGHNTWLTVFAFVIISAGSNSVSIKQKMLVHSLCSLPIHLHSTGIINHPVQSLMWAPPLSECRSWPEGTVSESAGTNDYMWSVDKRSTDTDADIMQ